MMSDDPDDYHQRESAQLVAALRGSMSKLELHTDVILDVLAYMAASAISSHPEIRSRCYARFMNSLITELRRYDGPADGERLQ